MTGNSFQGKKSLERKEQHITFKIIVDMITPGAVFLSAFNPALLGVILSIEKVGRGPVLLTLFLILIPCAANCSVNLLNDYYDYVGGNDTAENIVLEQEGPLAYHHVADPRPAFYLGAAFFAAAALMGVYVIVKCGIVPAVIGAAGAVVTWTYSGKRVSTSHMPIGEFLSGFTLGGLVPLAVYASLTAHRTLSAPVLLQDYLLVLFKAVPMILIVSMFMLANNTCDIERDRIAGRKTMPIIVGRDAAERLSRITVIVFIAQLLLVLSVWYPAGIPVIALALFIGRKGIAGTYCEPRTRENKIRATLALVVMNMCLSVGYLASIAVHLLVVRIAHIM